MSLVVRPEMQMETSLLQALAVAVFIFTTIKMIFGFFAWLFPELDRVHRTHLDTMIDALDEKSLFRLGQLVLVRILESVRGHFSRRPIRSYMLVGMISLVLNIVVFTATSTAVVSTHFLTISEGVTATLASIQSAGWFNFFTMNVLVGILGLCFDLLSLVVTLVLLTRASVATTGRTLMGHMCVDSLVAVVSCM